MDPKTPSVATTEVSSTPAPKSSKPKGLILPLAILFLIIGLGVGYFISRVLPSTSTTAPSAPEVNQATGDVALPADAVRIQGCSDHRGSLYVKPSDIPVGPVYMVNNGKVIGIE